jgi:hypothetical protein
MVQGSLAHRRIRRQAVELAAYVLAREETAMVELAALGF